MKKSYIIILIVFSVLSCSKKGTQSIVPGTDQIVNNFQQNLESIYTSNPESIGIMVHIESPGKKISWSGAVGYSYKQEKTKLRINQPVLIASNTKTFVAATILRLEEQAKLSLTAAIDKYLTEETQSVLSRGGYDNTSIQLIHLLSHTSGISDYVDSEEFATKLSSNPKYKWTRKEQIELAVLAMDKTGKAGEKYKYSDTNYLLLTEIIEEVSQMKYYEAIRKLLDFKNHGLNHTWFESLEIGPTERIPLAHQYVGELKLDTYDLDESFDLFGGGGLASTTKDLALFFQKLFNKKVFKNPQTLDKLLTKVVTEETANSDYRLGIWKSTILGKTVYGHGGFWGSMVYYIPEINSSMSIIILEKDKSYLRKEVAEVLIAELINKS